MEDQFSPSTTAPSPDNESLQKVSRQQSQTQEKSTAERTKRSRVPLACQRCKRRKQKCNGEQPSCSTCTRLEVACHYVMPTHPKPGQARLYIKALEHRVAELETSLTDGGHGSSIASDHWNKPNESGQEIHSLLTAVRDLSIDVAGSYVGGASTISLGRVLENAVGRRLQLPLPPAGSGRDLNSVALRRASSDVGSSLSENILYSVNVPSDLADTMLQGYLTHLSSNYPIIFSSDLRDIHRRRASLDDVYEESILHLVYSLGGYFQKTTGHAGVNYNCDQHFEIAYEKRELILGLGNLQSLTYLLLLTQHCVRMPKEPGAWTFIGLAMKMCVQIGLHRRRRPVKPNKRTELEKRLFWACYYWDRETAIALGRPPTISDHDIDVQLPLDVDEDAKSSEILFSASQADLTRPANPPTTLTCFVHLIRLKRLESQIQHTVYRVDSPTDPISSSAATDRFLERLMEWKDAIPPQSRHWDTDEVQIQGSGYHSLDSYMISWYKCVRLLLQPQLYGETINERYFKLCIEACGGICETYKRLHHRMPLAFTTVSLQNVFLAGLTLVYCMWQDPASQSADKSLSALTDCSIMLYVMTERWPEARKYRDVFESIKRLVLNMIAEGKHQPRKAVSMMNDEVLNTLQGVNFGNMVAENSRDDLEQMIGDMTGERMWGWDDMDIGSGVANADFDIGDDAEMRMVLGSVGLEGQDLIGFDIGSGWTNNGNGNGNIWYDGTN